MPRTQTLPVLALLIRSGARSSGRSGSAPSWEAAALEALHGGLVVPDRVVLVDTTGPDDADDSDTAAASEDSEGSGDSEVSDVESADDADTDEAAGVEGVDGVVFVDAEGDREDLLAEALLQAVDNADEADDPEGDAAGHWLWVLGDVDGLVPDPDCLAELLAAAESHPDVGVLLPRADGARIADDAYPAEAPGALIRVTWESADAETDADEVALSVPNAYLLPASRPVRPTQEDRERSARREAWRRALLAPPTILAGVLTVLSLFVHGVLADRFGWDLAGGALLPMAGLGDVWSAYFSSWHGVAGGTTSAASPAMAVLGVFGVLGGPDVAVSLLLLLAMPAAGLVAYAATRRSGLDRWIRAGGAAAYALIPAATDAVAAGRLDIVVVHIAAPAVAAGLTSLVTRADVRWLPMSTLCALGLALLGAFSPITYGMAVVGLLIAFVVLPTPAGRTGRGIPALVLVVLLPLALLMPWLPTLVSHPALLLHGITGPADPATVTGLLGLHPAGGVPLGIALVLAAVVACVLAPGRHLVPGLVLTALGVTGLLVVGLVHVTPLTGGAAAAGYAGAPLIVLGMGLVGIVLGACRGGLPAMGSLSTSGRAPAAGVAGGALTLAALVLAVSFASTAEQPRGEVRAGGGLQLAADLEAELADGGRGVLVLGQGGRADEGAVADRLTAARTPSFGDDALAPVDGMTERLEGWRYGILAGSRDALTNAAAAGVLFVVLPPGEDGAAVQRDAGDLVEPVTSTSDGRTVLRLTPESGQVTLVSPEQAHRAVSGAAPSDELMRGEAIASVDARLPEAHVRVSDGPEGRLLVLAAEHAPGWTATVDGEPVPITPAWGHQVAVSVPESESEVVVQYSSPAHGVFLLGSVAALLFATLTAIPSRRPRV